MKAFMSSALAAALALLNVGCSHSVTQSAASPHRQSTPEIMIQYGCPTCHVIPHVPGAVGKVGPSLDELSQRSVLAGSLPNSPQNLQLWIMHPQHFQPGTAMPEMGVTPQDAQQIAAFLYANH